MRKLISVAVVLGAGLQLENKASASALNIGDLLVVDQNSQGTSLADGRIIRVNPIGGQQTLLSSGGFLADPDSITTDLAGNLLVTDYNAQAGAGALIRIDPNTGNQALVSAGGLLSHPVGVRVGPDGNIYVSQHGTGSSTSGILRIDPSNGSQTVVKLGGLFRVPENIVFDSQGQLLVADAQARGAGIGAVIKLNPATGAQTFVPSGQLAFPSGIALEPNGKIIVSEHDPSQGIARLTRIDPSTGNTSIISSLGNLTLPDEVYFDLDFQGVVHVADLDALGGGGGIIAVDRLSGNQSVISSGGFFVNPTGISSVVPEPGSLLLAGLAILGMSRCRRRRS